MAFPLEHQQVLVGSTSDLSYRPKWSLLTWIPGFLWISASLLIKWSYPAHHAELIWEPIQLISKHYENFKILYKCNVIVYDFSWNLNYLGEKLYCQTSHGVKMTHSEAFQYVRPTCVLKYEAISQSDPNALSFGQRAKHSQGSLRAEMQPVKMAVM